MNVLKIKHSFFRYKKILNFSRKKFSFFNFLEEKDIMNIPIENIRNFCIIAHIDHGKSTLSDRILEYCGAINKLKKENQQILDNLQVEKDRGITVKAQTATMIFNFNETKYLLNLIDTPGHVDFSFEVIRSLKPCQGAILLIDASKGIQAQTVANYNHAKSLNLKILPVLNKIDLSGVDVEESKNQIIETFKSEFIENENSDEIEKSNKICRDNIIGISAKQGVNIDVLMKYIISFLPPPKKSINVNKKFKGLLYDAKYVETKGVIMYIEVLEGEINKNISISSYQTGKSYDIFEVGIVQPEMNKMSTLREGQVGYIISNLKDIKEAKIGDTLFDKKISKTEIVPESSYFEPKCMVFSGIYPNDPSEYLDLKKGLEKLCLTDYSIKYEPETSASLGAGFRVGFLGLLHMEVFHQRLEDDYGIEVIITAPSTKYKIKVKDHVKNLEAKYPNLKIPNKDQFEKDRILYVENIISCPDKEDIQYIEEPFIEAEVITPKEYINSINHLILNKRGEEILSEEIGENMIKGIYDIPLNEVMLDFYDKLKSISKGYASFDYKISSYKRSEIRFVNFLIHGDQIDALGFFSHESNAETNARKMVEKLKKHIPQQLFSFALQGKVDNRIVCREDVKALKKNVTSKCYGGDITRRMKLLEKQKKGKKKMREFGSVKFSSETFYNILKDNE